MQETVNQRIKMLVKEKTFGNAKLFAEQAGLSQNTIASIINGQSQSVTEKTLRKIHDKYPEVDMHWLITGKGEMVRNNQVIGDVTGNQNTTSNQFGQDESKKVMQLYEKIIALQEENSTLRKKIDKYEKKSDYVEVII